MLSKAFLKPNYGEQWLMNCRLMAVIMMVFVGALSTDPCHIAYYSERMRKDRE